MAFALLLILTVVGVLMFALAANPKVSEIGKWVFIVGLFYLVPALTALVGGK